MRSTFAENALRPLKDFQDKLSTNPDNVNSVVTSAELTGLCCTIAIELRDRLENAGMTIDTVTSAHKDTNLHRYLITIHNGVEVIIDPTLGQFIDGHDHVFVGTRDQLKDVVLQQTSGETARYKIINTDSKVNPEEAFERIWGEQSRIRFASPKDALLTFTDAAQEVGDSHGTVATGFARLDKQRSPLFCIKMTTFFNTFISQ